MLKLLLFSLIIIVGCTSPVSFYEEQQASSNTINWLKTKSSFIDDKPTDRYFTSLTTRLNLAIKFLVIRDSISNNNIQNINWHIHILKDERPAAFSVGAGNIVLTSGLIKELHTESELAAILSHEMAHQILGHINTQLARHKTNTNKPELQFSIEDETAADQLGLKVLKQSGFEPSASLTAFNVILKEYSKEASPPKWLSQRAAFLFQQLNQGLDGIPRTYDSREFQKMRAEL